MSMVLRLDEPLDKRLGHAAIDQGTTKTALIRQAIMAMLGNVDRDSDE